MPGFSLFPRKRPSAFQLPKLIISIAIFSAIVTGVAKGATIEVPSGGNLQAALDVANCGDTIVLQAGESYIASLLEQPFLAKAKGACTGTNSDFITIRGSNVGALPASLRDLSLSQISALSLPKLITKVSTPALEFEAGSHHYRFVGIEITNDSVNQTQLNNGLVFVGENSGSQRAITLANVPHDIEFDRCYVHPETSDGTTSEYSTAIRGFFVSAKNLTIRNSRIAGFRTFWKPGYSTPLSSNAILINKGPGPYTISGNYMEAWFGTVFTGGGPQWVVNSASVAPGATTNQATLTNVVGSLPSVGDYIAFLAPNMIFSVGVFHGQPYEWGAAKVTAVNGSTISYEPKWSNNLQSAWGTGLGGTPLTSAPSSPGMAVWNGDRPKDILIDHNKFVKEPVSLAAVNNQYGYSSKGHIELKVGLRTTINANTFEGYHLAFVFTPRNQSSIAEGGGKNVWSTLDDTVFTNNWVKPAPAGGQVFGIQLDDETCTVAPGSGMRIENNLFESGTKLVNLATSKNVQFIHNTFTGNSGLPTDTDQVVFNYGGPSENLQLRDNILYNNGYGMNCQLTATPCWPGLGISGNVIIDNRTQAEQLFQGPLSGRYPSGNYYSSTLAGLQFVDAANGNWRLSAGSPYKGRGTNGTDPGVNMDTLVAALGAAYTPGPTATPTPTPNPTPTPTPTPTSTGYFQLSSPIYYVGEGGGSAQVTVRRTNSTGSASVDYRTSDTAGLVNCDLVNGVASARCDYTIAVGTLHFAAGESVKNISIPIVDDGYADGNEAFTIALSNANGATLDPPRLAIITIQDQATNGGNPIDGTAFFVRQQYLDFLNREPDAGGYAAWQQALNNCQQGDPTCDRIQVSSAFFRSPEFQDRGYFVYRFYPVSFGRKPDYAEFAPDLAKLSGFLSDAELEGAKAEFIAAFMNRPGFVTKFNGLSDTQYVDTLLATAGVTSPNRDFWIAALGNGTRSRATVLREISESAEVYSRYYNQAFVVMQYFGYLRRDPDGSYLDWVNVLNSSGDFRGIVNGFVNSLEYRFRVGPG